MTILSEVCVDSLEAARLAAACGADRLEVCANLLIGGTTPSLGLLRLIRKEIPLPLHVLIRPRAGDFVYSRDELLVILADISAAKECGADGIVCGALTVENDLDLPALTAMQEAAAGLSFTFHRAFDCCRDPQKALSILKKHGVQRLLSSGCAPSAAEGIPLLQNLMAQAGNLIIMPGGGVRPANIHALRAALPLQEIHFSGTQKIAAPPGAVKMGVSPADEWILRADAAQLHALISALR